MNLIDHYPETLRDIYDKLEETIGETHGAAVPGLAWETVEWIRAHWSRRTLIPSWWGHAEAAAAEPAQDDTLPGVEIQVDPLRTIRGRELRDRVLSIILVGFPITRPCHLATAIAAQVESAWSRSQVYIPQASAVDRAIRDARIWQDFNGFATIDKVVATHNVSQSVIYDTFRRLQKDKDAREQPSLFDL